MISDNRVYYTADKMEFAEYTAAPSEDGIDDYLFKQRTR